MTIGRRWRRRRKCPRSRSLGLEVLAALRYLYAALPGDSGAHQRVSLTGAYTKLSWRYLTSISPGVLLAHHFQGHVSHIFYFTSRMKQPAKFYCRMQNICHSVQYQVPLLLFVTALVPGKIKKGRAMILHSAIQSNVPWSFESRLE